VVGTLAFASAAHAAPLRVRDAGPVGLDARDDGRRRIASATGDGPVSVLDVVTGTRMTVPTPGGCRFADVARGGSLLWNCAAPNRPFGSGVIRDLATGRAAVLAAQRPPPPTTPDSASYSALGRRWARVTFFGYHYSFDVYVDRRTGRQVRPDERNRNRVPDLDASPLTRALCSGMQRPLIPDGLGTGVEPGPLAVAGRNAAATSYDRRAVRGRVLLERCGRAPELLQRCHLPAYCSQPVIDDRFVAWTVDRWSPGRGSTLHVRSLKTGRARSLQLLTAPAPTLMLVAHRLFLASEGRMLRVSL
jgi:hypothetical protein